MADPVKNGHTVVLSQSSDDDGVAERIFDALTAAGIDCWFRRRASGSPGSGFEIFADAARSARYIISIQPARAAYAGIVADETELAAAYASQFVNPTRIIPVIHHGNRVPDQLERWSAVDLGDDPAVTVDRVKQIVRSDAEMPAQPPDDRSWKRLADRRREAAMNRRPVGASRLSWTWNPFRRG